MNHKRTLSFFVDWNDRTSVRIYERKNYAKNREKRRWQAKLNYDKNPEKYRNWQREYRIKNQEKVRAYGRKSRLRNRRKIKERGMRERIRKKIDVFRKYSKGSFKCKCCGCNDIRYLTLDHIKPNPLPRNLRPNTYTFYRYLIKSNFPKGYQILCFYCNASKNNRNKCDCKKYTDLIFQAMKTEIS